MRLIVSNTFVLTKLLTPQMTVWCEAIDSLLSHTWVNIAFIYAVFSLDKKFGSVGSRFWNLQFVDIGRIHSSFLPSLLCDLRWLRPFVLNPFKRTRQRRRKEKKRPVSVNLDFLFNGLISSSNFFIWVVDFAL